ncbi:MAG: type II toxin-antitoxin system VapC family toxin [Methanosarcinales archaeon Met12]|nr:MAG: type II toxin-antitoxin system VapC family toxin [Methanosarcinales archaeon Met12]
MKHCLDSYAIISLIQGGDGADKVKRIISGDGQKVMSTVNAAEVYNIILRRRGEEHADEKFTWFTKLNIEFMPPDVEIAREAGRFKMKYSFALGDAFCLATAVSAECKIVTGDSEFGDVSEVEIVWV